MKTTRALSRGGQILIPHLRVADDPWSRLRGLIGTAPLGSQDGLFFPRCSSVHMWFMGFPIDVVFLKKRSATDYEVRRVFAALRPWRPLPVWTLGATDALEIASGSAGRLGLREGEVLCIN